MVGVAAGAAVVSYELLMVIIRSVQAPLLPTGDCTAALAILRRREPDWLLSSFIHGNKRRPQDWLRPDS